MYTALVLACVLVGSPLGALVAQGTDDEIVLLREAASMETDGRLAEAEAILFQVLERRPTSTPALLALERVLRQQGRIADLVTPAEQAVAEEPGSALLNQLLLRTYSWLDRQDAIVAAGAAWMDATPTVETPYREVGRIWEEKGDYQRARQALELGRERVPADDALALELGALYAALQDHDLAEGEWDRAIGPHGAGVNQVRRHLQALPDGGAAVIPGLVDRLARQPTSAGRLSAAVDLALAAGLEPPVVALAERLLDDLEADRRDRFLLDLARRGDGAGLSRVAHWAYGRLVARGHADALPVVRTRYGELESELGVTGVGGVVLRMEEPPEPGAAPPREAAAVRVELLARQDPSEALVALRAFRDEYRDDAATDALAATVSEALLEAGDVHAAEAAVAGVRGPRSAVVRGRLALDRGEIEDARSAYLSAASGLRGAEATRLLSLASLLGRVSSEGAAAIGRAVTRVAEGDPGVALDGLTADLDRLPAVDRPGIIEFAASLAEAHGLQTDARALRRGLITHHPRAAETPAALLALARSLGPEAPDEARELLERLIMEYPRSALVPQARRELEQARRRGMDTGRNHSGSG